MTIFTDHIGNTTKTICTTKGKLWAILLNTANASAQTITLYDNSAASGTVLAVFSICYWTSPTLIEFPKDFPLTFEIGLTVVATNCYVNVFAST